MGSGERAESAASLSSVYEPAAVESRWYATWRERGYFRPDEDRSKPPFCVVLPPPNVTGRLHMGHALTATIEDCLVRWRRMSGHAALWLPGTDHAGIATQVMVERELEKEGKTRLGVGREEFLRRTWAWKDEHGGIIDRQHEALGASLEWSRYRFTMDPESSRAVREAFCRLHEDGLVYRAYRLINWDWVSQTALSDLEVEHREVAGHLWHLAYPVEGTDERLVVATTRPETMLGDTGVAVHPDDPRYRHLVGKKVVLPLTGRAVPIVADPILVDMEFGTGAVKVTPAHDFNDFATGKRHGLEVLCILDLHGRLNDAVPERFRGLAVKQARKRVVEALEQAGALVEVRDHKMNVGFSQRTGEVVEPMPSTQWYVNVKPLADPAIEAVRAGKTRFFPEHRTQDFHRWMENIHDWCISRQLWWGHRIPAWYCDACDHVTVSRIDPEACAGCGGRGIRQDEDVLDTWFSSGLWPLTTLGWPDREDDLARFYPTQLMETGWDILFFWVARMMMFGIRLRGDVPFREVFLHSMVLGEDGQKMSKTKGNVVDPMGLVEQYGADPLRFYLCTMAGQDLGIVFSKARVEGYRHFTNKLWNAARFALMNLEGYEPEKFAKEVVRAGNLESLSIYDRWILTRAAETAREVDGLLGQYRLDLAAHAAYQFVWYELCDWYLELAKPALRQGGAARTAAQGTIATVFDVMLRVLHPMIPFVTEEIWTRLPRIDRSEESLMTATFPIARAADRTALAGPLSGFDNAVSGPPAAQAHADVQCLRDLVTTIRSLKAEFKLPPQKGVALQLRCDAPEVRARVVRLAPAIGHLARVEPLEILDAAAAAADPSGVDFVAGIEVILPLGGLVDVAAERDRLAKERTKLQGQLEGLRRKLESPGFRAKAPAEVVAKDEARGAELGSTVEKLTRTLARLGA